MWDLRACFRLANLTGNMQALSLENSRDWLMSFKTTALPAGGTDLSVPAPQRPKEPTTAPREWTERSVPSCAFNIFSLSGK